MSLNCQITGVANSPSWMMMGRTCARSRIWMIKADTASVSPMVKSSSIRISSGTHTVVGYGTKR